MRTSITNLVKEKIYYYVFFRTRFNNKITLGTCRTKLTFEELELPSYLILYTIGSTIERKVNKLVILEIILYKIGPSDSVTLFYLKWITRFNLLIMFYENWTWNIFRKISLLSILFYFQKRKCEIYYWIGSFITFFSDKNSWY